MANQLKKKPRRSKALQRAKRLVTLLCKYGQGKFKDEWWPGNAGEYLSEKEAAELEQLLG